MMEWMLMPYRRYAEFSGRSRRKEYWMFMLFYLIVILGLVLIGALLGSFQPAPDGSMSAGAIVFFGLLGIFGLGSFIPALAVQVRRFHDQDKSGWLILLGFIPYLGGLILFIFMCIEGTRGDNSHGADPKSTRHLTETFS